MPIVFACTPVNPWYRELMRTKLFSVLACGVVFVGGSLSSAGPLNPPAGVVAPTAKPLVDVEPRIAINVTNTPGDPPTDASPSTFKISQPGSYYLTANLAGEAGKAGIEIAADNVTLDLNGFTVSNAGTNGITATTANQTNTVIRNGTVQLSAQDGIDLNGSTNARVENVTSTFNVGFGIEVGNRATVVRCLARANGNHGITASNECLISDCVSSVNVNAGTNNPRGIVAGFRSVVSRCVVNDNEGNGIVVGIACRVTDCTSSGSSFTGIVAGQGSVISGCISQSNTTGFSADFGSTYVACTARDNSGSGFSVNGSSIATDCTALNNNIGFDTFTNARLTRCVAQNSSSHGFSIISSALTECSAANNGGSGFRVLVTSPGSTFTNCAASSNALSGFEILSARARLIDCHAEGNTQHGVILTAASNLAESIVQSCVLSNNGFSGITAQASTSIIDCNVSNNSDVGISVLTSCTIRGCTVNTNLNSGIFASGTNIIQNNTISSNAAGAAGGGAAGILCTADDNRIEGNHLISNAQDGIRLNASGNLVIRNTLARTGTTINAVAGNRIAQTITLTTTGFVSTDPNANYIY